ncbi:MAG: PilZ domain-containing protein [Pseudomonadota bacterium]
MIPDDMDDVRSLRGQPRLKVFLPIEIYAGTTPLRAHLLDLSASGALVHSIAAPATGTPVRLMVAGLVRTARVVWQDGVRFGIAFVVPLRDVEVERMLAPAPAMTMRA